MNELVFIENEQVITDSLTIAEMFDKRHDHVLRDIKNQIELAGEEFSSPNFGESTYETRGKEYPKFNLTEEAFTLVVFSYNTKEAVQTKIKFIKEFKRMREFIESQQQQKQFTAREQLLLIMQANEETAQRVDEIDEKVTHLTNTMRVDSLEEQQLKSLVEKKAIETLGGKQTKAYAKISRKVFKSIWGEFKRHFEIPRYGMLPKVKFSEGQYFISIWQPSASLRMEIEQLNGQGSLF